MTDRECIDSLYRIKMCGEDSRMHEALDMAIKIIRKPEPIHDKIRAEIADLAYDDPEDDYEYGNNDVVLKVIQIIDKYNGK